MDFDVAVVGAGLIGLAAAREFCVSRPDLKVGVIDAGPWAGDSATLTELRERAATMPYVARWDTANNLFRGHGLKEVVGGRSMCWGGVSPRLQESALAAWPLDLCHSPLDPYFERAEELMHVRRVAGQASKLHAIRELTGRTLHPLRRALLADGTPYSPVINLRETSITVVAETRVRSVVRSERCGITVHCSSAVGAESQITARVVVLACGALVTGALLAASALQESGGHELTTAVADHIVLGTWTALRENEFDELDGLDSGTESEGPFYEIVQGYRLGNDRVLDWWAMGDCPPAPERRMIVRLRRGVTLAEVDFNFAANDHVTRVGPS